MTFWKRLYTRIARKGLPILISIITGIVIGLFINGAAALFIGAVAGLVFLWFLGKLPFKLTPWQSLLAGILPIIGKLSFFMFFLLPVASYLSLPSGHTPNTITKYASIVVMVPSNLFSMPRSDVFPGLVIIVLASIALMLWGGFQLNKSRGWNIALAGLLLYTFSPTITSIILGNFQLRIIMSFFSVGYYMAWLGLIIMLIIRFLPRFLPAAQPPSRSFGMMGILPPMIAIGALNQMVADPSPSLSLFSAFSWESFELAHHFIAGVFSATIAGAGAGYIVDGAINDGSDNADHDESDAEEPDDTYNTGEGWYNNEPQEPLPSGPQPYSDPENDVPEGSTLVWNADRTQAIITKPDGDIITVTKYPDGTEVAQSKDGIFTRYGDDTTYWEGVDGSKTVEYPDGTVREWSPDGYSMNKHPDGSFEATRPDGSTISLTINKDGTMDCNSSNGENLHFPKEGSPVGTLTGGDGIKYTFNGDGTGSMTSPYGGTMNIDKDGNAYGSFSDADGNKITITPEGTAKVETKEGDILEVGENGFKATMQDGQYLEIDASGNPIKAHIQNEFGQFDINTDEKGTHITGQDAEGSFEQHIDSEGNVDWKDDKGNNGHVNADGSGHIDGPDASGSWDANGNGEITTSEGVKWTAKSDGSGSISDNKGNKMELGSDGGVKVTDATSGKTTTYTPDEVGQMKAQVESDSAGSPDAS